MWYQIEAHSEGSPKKWVLQFVDGLEGKIVVGFYKNWRKMKVLHKSRWRKPLQLGRQFASIIFLRSPGDQLQNEASLTPQFLMKHKIFDFL
jgi:hypothetical protein